MNIWYIYIYIYEFFFFFFYREQTCHQAKQAQSKEAEKAEWGKFE